MRGGCGRLHDSILVWRNLINLNDASLKRNKKKLLGPNLSAFPFRLFLVKWGWKLIDSITAN